MPSSFSIKPYPAKTGTALDCSNSSALFYSAELGDNPFFSEYKLRVCQAHTQFQQQEYSGCMENYLKAAK